MCQALLCINGMFFGTTKHRARALKTFDVAVVETVLVAFGWYLPGQVGEFGEDNRAGIDRTLHRISCLRNRDGGIVGLTCRVGRAVPGSAALIADLARSGKSILLLGRPGSGKTTLLRDVSRMLAAECRRRVVIVDTR